MGFTRTIEDFTCGHCGSRVTGDGYTNHCPTCLWSKHVDIEPGDRAKTCGGMMRPLRVEGSAGAFRIVHRCEACGFERINRAQDGDNQDALVRIAEIWTKQKMNGII